MALSLARCSTVVRPAGTQRARPVVSVRSAGDDVGKDFVSIFSKPKVRCADGVVRYAVHGSRSYVDRIQSHFLIESVDY
jgi:hypothetical protein